MYLDEVHIELQQRVDRKINFYYTDLAILFLLDILSYCHLNSPTFSSSTFKEPHITVSKKRTTQKIR